MTHSNYWTRRAISRRRILSGSVAGGLGALGFGLVGCGDDDENNGGVTTTATTTTNATESATSTDGEPRSGGVLTSSFVPESQASGFDPHGLLFAAYFTKPTHSRLVDIQQDTPNVKDWKFVPGAAASWEIVSDTEVVFTLQDNLKFHDIDPTNGRAATADDVRYSIERISADLQGFARKHEFKDVTVEAVSANVVRMRMARPMAAFWNRLVLPGTVIMAQEAVDAEGGQLKSGNPTPGTGPFIHQDLEVGRSFSVRRNPDYFKPGQPYLDEYRAIQVADSQTAWATFKSGGLDMIEISGSDVNPDIYEEANGLSGVRVETRPGFLPLFTIFNTTMPPFDNPSVRRALSLIAPRQELLQIIHRGFDRTGDLSGPGGFSNSVHGDATWSEAELVKRPGYRPSDEREADLAEARKLLDAAGVSEFEGKALAYLVPPLLTLSNSVQVLVEEFAKFGFTFDIEALSPGDTSTRMSGTTDWAVGITTAGFSGIDPDDVAVVYHSAAGARNFGKWSHPDFERLLLKEQEQTDITERNETLREMIELLEIEVPRISSTNNRMVYAYNDKIQGLPSPIATRFPYSFENMDSIWRKA